MRYQFGGLIFGGAYFRNFTVFPLDNLCIIMCIFCQHVFVGVFQTSENVTRLLTALQDDIGNLSEDVSYIARLDLILCIDILQKLKFVDNDDCDGNENGKTRTGISKTTSSHAPRFLYISLSSLHYYDVKLSYCTFYQGHPTRI